jgi:hypothetical protein
LSFPSPPCIVKNDEEVGSSKTAALALFDDLFFGGGLIVMLFEAGDVDGPKNGPLVCLSMSRAAWLDFVVGGGRIILELVPDEDEEAVDVRAGASVQDGEGTDMLV